MRWSLGVSVGVMEGGLVTLLLQILGETLHQLKLFAGELTD